MKHSQLHYAVNAMRRIFDEDPQDAGQVRVRMADRRFSASLTQQARIALNVNEVRVGKFRFWVYRADLPTATYCLTGAIAALHDLLTTEMAESDIFAALRKQGIFRAEAIRASQQLGVRILRRDQETVWQPVTLPPSVFDPIVQAKRRYIATHVVSPQRCLLAPLDAVAMYMAGAQADHIAGLDIILRVDGGVTECDH